MVREVKQEIFGSRPSVIEPILQKAGIHYIKDIFILTCRSKFNENKKTRYLVLVEFKSEDDMNSSVLESVSECLNADIKNRVIGVCLKENQANLLFMDNNDIEEFSIQGLKDFLLEKTGCPYIESFAQGSEHATALSRFFRENLGKSVSITDIDFFIPNKCLFLEEKTFIEIRDNKKYGYLGKGQCLSYRELISDLIDESKSSLYLIFVDNSNFYIQKFDKNINCNKTKEVSSWGTMVEIDLDEKPLNSNDLVRFILS